ncbi:YbdD/YjiX family protein [Chimaeribacter coloradensis]|uniref:YbdD/YjiX family protein n=1 Tax=Chimaeribacter coloradensis TaxID=2060068 RepID=UPI0013FCF8F4
MAEPCLLRAAARPSALIIKQCYPLAGDLPPGNRVRLFFRRLAQSFRLMVGVHDYQAYLRHHRQHHPTETPMSERAFHRYCLEARFPSQGGKLGKCPC